GNHLVKNQKRAIPRTFLTQHCEVIIVWKIETRIGWDWLQNYRRNFVFVLSKGFSHHLDIVERQRNCEIRERLRHTGAARLTVCERAASTFHQERIHVPVVAAVKLDDLI